MKRIYLLLFIQVLFIPFTYADISLDTVQVYRLTMLSSMGTIIMGILIYYIIWKNNREKAISRGLKRNTLQAVRKGNRIVMVKREKLEGKSNTR